MFEKLVESSGKSVSTRARRTLLTASSFFVASFVASAVVFSLYNHTLGMGSEPGDIARLLAPVSPDIVPDSNPATDRKQESAEPSRNPMRTKLVQRPEEVPLDIPDKVSSVPSTVPSMPPGPVEIGNRNWDPPRGSSARGGGEDNVGLIRQNVDKSEDSVEKEPKRDLQAVPDPPKLERPPQHVGVVNSKAIRLDKPEYPAIARQMGIRGSVKIQVLIDTEGRVVTASVLEGPKVLQDVSLKAARASKFSPTIVNTTPVSVRGIIIYNFK